MLLLVDEDVTVHRLCFEVAKEHWLKADDALAPACCRLKHNSSPKQPFAHIMSAAARYCCSSTLKSRCMYPAFYLPPRYLHQRCGSTTSPETRPCADSPRSCPSTTEWRLSADGAARGSPYCRLLPRKLATASQDAERRPFCYARRECRCIC